ncbi:UxaA family hydrolase [Pseudodesulfovibrio thermohalotolerans]|uniref:UxaA family hydrolase n=1 Tax=Pseudodesulfovibrio thermohalotolerans TaxID=2880651 RepID=UPI002443270E|nr:UxaA family hydrolase [Pseudodesulfovibrio thermohalotolerans]WFS62610.1 UxaA family hydrolase [Pseudodesulfovibrio thermohalotolerans]
MIIGNGYVRKDGRKGIRNVVVVTYLVQCASHVAKKIAGDFGDTVHLAGFTGCYPNDHANRIMTRLCTHPNVGGVVVVALGCESFPRNALVEAVRESGRPVELVVIQEDGGTASSVAKGKAAVSRIQDEIADAPRAPMHLDELVVGTVCGGSDATSGIAANPAVGLFFDKFIDDGGTGIFEETGELIGCEEIIRHRSATPEIGEEVVESIHKAARYYTVMGHGSFAPGNAEGGLTTQEEKSMGAYAKSGSCSISGVIRPGQIPSGKGLYLMDVIPDGEPRFGFPNINDVTEIIEMAASGCHIMLYTTGRGSVAGSAVIPTIKVCANPETYRRMPGDMDIDAGRVLEGRGTLPEVGQEIYDLVVKVGGGTPSKSEALGHQEFELPYKTFAIEESPFDCGCAS